MPFRVRWTDPNGAQSETLPGATAALKRYWDLAGRGYPAVRVYDDSGIRLNEEALAQLQYLEKKAAAE